MENSREVFDAVLKNVGKIRDGKPRAAIFFATTARASEDREILAAQEALKVAVANTGYFRHVDVNLTSRADIDRKSVEKGKSVSVRVDSGGRRINKKKKNKTRNKR